MSLAGTRVLVTGAGGFIGSHVVEALVHAGATVRGLVRYVASGARGWLDALPREVRDTVEVVAGDVRDPGSVEAAARGTSVALHLAALSGIPYSYAAPEAYVATNISGTLHVLQAARRAALARVVITSSSEVYGSAQRVPMDERHPQRAQSPYAASKIAADQLAESFAHSFGVPVVVLRPFNAFGPRQSARAVIPAILTQLFAGADVVALGNLTPRRDFTYVEDLARAFVAVAAAPGLSGETLNVASGQEIAIDDLARALIARVRPGARVVESAERLRPAGAEVERLLGCSARLRALTGWRPAWHLERGLDATVAWYREAANRARVRADGYQV
ncbi:MAG: SDR family NAD(P)-dependent oxidoreductase [Deltaproteobacteria bacterium]|nr:SDR family NAD(P)-dependent oxidoreductase [Deltaproteobacteria bacterium]